MIRRFSVLILLCQQMTYNKTICEGNPVWLTDVNMTSKRAFHQKVTELLNSTTKKWGFT